MGFDEDGQPFVIPTIHARVNDMLYVHGEKSSMKLKQSASGITMCITVTLFDGLVVARSLFHHSMNYRSTIVFGQGRLVTDAKEKFEALMAIAENLIHGRWDEAREPNKKELRATRESWPLKSTRLPQKHGMAHRWMRTKIMSFQFGLE